jgi:hypothetical protein
MKDMILRRNEGHLVLSKLNEDKGIENDSRLSSFLISLIQYIVIHCKFDERRC